MAEYRAYSVGYDGHFVGYEGFVACDDDEAIRNAKRLLCDHDIELWNGERFVMRLNRNDAP